jgi:hypothetical protein
VVLWHRAWMLACQLMILVLWHADPQVAKGLAAGGGTKPRICLHGTPRQWDDPTRPWIGAQPAAFALFTTVRESMRTCLQLAVTCLHSYGLVGPHACMFVCSSGREAQRFQSLLAAEGLPVTSRKYFAGEPLSLEMHFEVIEAMQADSAGVS